MNVLRALAAGNEPAVLVTLAALSGSAPRRPGAHMLVTSGGVRGSVGGGELEHGAISHARAMLAGDRKNPVQWSASLERFGIHQAPDDPAILPADDQCVGADCGVLLYELLPDGRGPWSAPLAHARGQPWVAIAGTGDPVLRAFVSGETVHGLNPEIGPDAWLVGRARALLADPTSTTGVIRAPSEQSAAVFFMDVIRPPEIRVAVFGAGHVGRAIVHILTNMPVDVTWIDDRAEVMPDLAADNVERRVVENPQEAAREIDGGSYCVVTTHSHELDREVCECLLNRDDLPFVGMIGSRRKRAGFERHWSDLGMEAERMSRLVCPIGLRGIGGRSPGEIGVAVVAQLLQVDGARRQGRGTDNL